MMESLICGGERNRVREFYLRKRKNNKPVEARAEDNKRAGLRKNAEKKKMWKRNMVEEKKVIWKIEEEICRKKLQKRKMLRRKCGREKWQKREREKKEIYMEETIEKRSYVKKKIC